MTNRIPITDATVRKYHDEGYFTVEGLFSSHEVEGVRREITKIVEDHPPVERGLVQLEPTVTEGQDAPDSTELGVRKLAKIAVRNDYFRDLAFHQGMVTIATTLLGTDVYLFQSMSLLKPPRIGGAKMWHQDNAYFRQTPCDVFGFWVACDDTTVENGCMHVIPGSHRGGTKEHDMINNDYILVNPPSAEHAVPIPLRAGDGLVFHGQIYHHTPPNRTDKRRRAIQYHYSSAKCRRTNDKTPYYIEPEILVSGNP
ncbi:MAG: phytanoyl-CoA dioxygenase family protein [Candidatus Poribacteria bacterium]|nr:phytanoyl-CoA dioxygenase family protein [Candidatus Poribacteria bacterium]